MADAFESSLPFVLRWEGGFVDHPNDPGGRTNKGVTQKTYDRWRARQGLPPEDVKDIDDATVKAIYKEDYWLPPHCDLLRRRMDLVHFDSAVNTGPGRATRWLQRAVGTEPDGAFGPITRRAADECDLASAVPIYCDLREAFYRRLADTRPDLRVFLKGWLNRLSALRLAASGSGELEAPFVLDFGDAAYIPRIPDLDEDPELALEVPAL